MQDKDENNGAHGMGDDEGQRGDVRALQHDVQRSPPDLGAWTAVL